MRGWVLGAWLTVASVARADDRVEVPDALRHPAVALPMAARDELRARDWDGAIAALQAVPTANLSGPERADLAFLQAWALLSDGRPAEAAPLLPIIDGVTTAPYPHLNLLRGEVFHAIGRDDDALAALAKVSEDSRYFGRALGMRAAILQGRGNAAGLDAQLRALVGRTDPTPGNDVALLALAAQVGPSTEEGYAALRRLWSWYPLSDAGKAGATQLSTAWPDRAATASERIRRGERYVEASMNDQALSALAGVTAPDASTEDGCRFAFVKGKALYKKNDLAGAVSAFGDAGLRCPPTLEDHGAKILYLKGYAEFRRNRYAESAASYGAIASRFPDSPMADDGLSRGGISLFEGGDQAGSMEMWRRALESFAKGDTVPEAAFRLAFAHYLQGHTDEAVRYARRTMELDVRNDWYNALAGHYWASRWLLYPDVNNPRQLVDAGARADGVAGLEALITAFPQNYYAQLAYARLLEVSPEAAKRVAIRPPADQGYGSWSVRRSFFEDPRVGHGVALARLGLVTEALAEWDAVDLAHAEPDEVAWLQELRVGVGDWLGAHKWMQQWHKTHPVGTLGAHEAQIIALSWPNRYWDDVQDTTQGYAYDPRMFHGLVREESSFDREITSFAGAKGLSQVMPGTAAEVAGWLGMKLSSGSMTDARTNLTLGGRYLQSVFLSMHNNPYLAMASYNAGPGRVNGWITAWNNPPTDEYVERIPVRETRDYVKKVSTSWQIMRYSFDRDLPPFPDLTAFNDAAKP